MGHPAEVARANLIRLVGQAIEYLDTRGGGPGRPPAEIAAVNRYQHDLEDVYDEWCDEAAKKLAAEKDWDKRRALLALLLLLLLSRLSDLGHKELPNAIAVGLGGEIARPDIYAKISEALAENDSYLKNSLLPDIEARMAQALNDPAIIAAVKAGSTAAASAAISSQAKLLGARVAQFSGSWWALMNYAVGAQAAEQGKRIRWTRDEQAKHCYTCLTYGEKTYNSFSEMLDKTGGASPADGTECRGNCRCILEIVD